MNAGRPEPEQSSHHEKTAVRGSPTPHLRYPPDVPSHRFLPLTLLALVLLPQGAQAYISQVDGTVVPQTGRMQACLDRSGTGESAVGAVDAIEDAAILPEAFRPVEDPPGSGNYPVTFRMIGEGAGFRNVFGYFWADEDVTDPDNLHMVFDCRVSSGACDCPCDPTSMRDTDGSPTSWERTLDFSAEPGFAAGRAIGFFIRTPEQLDGTRVDGNNCGDPRPANQNHRTYFTSAALNDDGDYAHFLIYESATFDNTYYFGFEDLFRGGDNDFEDVLARVTGLVPLCTPTLETCDGTDEDCDLAVDEGLTQDCSTACGDGVRTCSGGSYGACSAPTPSSETCDGTDEDCDTRVDEGLTRACSNECGDGTEICVMGSFTDCSAPTPSIETCNDDDDDCDGLTDEGITRACLSACGSGTEMCMSGSFAGCTAPTPTVETCNATDDDCDGLTDEDLTRPCSTECGDGTEVCISGMYVGCSAPTPRVESCNGVDDDCDGEVDEEITRTCSTACGVGSETCVDGAFEGCDAPTPSEEICDNVDNDCDGVIDDGDPGGGAMCLPDGMGGYEIVDEAPSPSDRCVPGRVRCEAGELVCRGAASPATEICNCEDDDCDGEIDEGDAEGLCPGDGLCQDCECLSPCADDEFGGCPPGQECDRSLADPEIGVIGYCREGMCAGVECSEEEVCDAATGECINLCDRISCGDDFACVRGRCVEDNCYGRGCPSGERCVDAACEADPCDGVACGAGEFCSEGDCVAVCTMSCPFGQACRGNTCVEEECARCSSTESCIDGECVTNSCSPPCGPGRVCRGDECVDDPCVLVECPGTTICVEGQCFAPEAAPRAEPILGLATGGGGCACAAAGTPSDDTPWAPAMLVLLVFGVRYRRRLTPSLSRSQTPSDLGAKPSRWRWLLLGGGALLLSGCDVEPYCFENCGDDTPIPSSDAGPVDAGGRDAEINSDGCVPGAEELCNEADDDCDGEVDEEFDLSRDPRHCGACESPCALPGAFPVCVSGECEIDRCEIGAHDLDGNPTNGCEYECLESGDEICDGVDNDCDGETDEGFDTSTDIGNCGECGIVCAFPNAAAMCEAGECVMGDCNPGFFDTNGEDSDGCEVACTPDGDEVCDGTDDDCDGLVDEGFDLSTSTAHCGRCGNACTFVRAMPVCADGVCDIGDCMDGFHDIDGLPSTGCEYACTPSGAETCNGSDDDCDGAVDESDPMVGMTCGSETGECSEGTWACQLGRRVCIGGAEPTPETCNTLDDDCDGTVDESVAGEEIPGTGERCGETNRGPCRFGTVECNPATGELVCGGAYRAPVAETCNGVDDDCDGAVDDSPAPPGSTPASCADTDGVCAGRTMACTGAGGWGCDFPTTYQDPETICDGLDNDCDDTVDEGCLVARPSSDRRVDLGDGVGAENSVQPIVGGDGGSRIYSAWMDLRESGGAHVFFNRSTNTGNTWSSSPMRMDTANGAAIGPRFGLTDGGRDVLVAWSDFRGGTSYREIFTRASTDFGASFGADTRRNVGQNLDSFNIDVAVSGSNVYAVYEAFSDERNRHIYFLRSTDGGTTWDPRIQVDDRDDSMPFVAATPQVAATGSDVHVVWRDNRNGGLDVFYRRSTNNGSSFLAGNTRIDTGTLAGADASFLPQVAASGDNVWVVWVDDRSGDSFDIYFNRSTNRGAGWLGTAVDIDDDPLPHESLSPRIATTGSGTFVVAWVDFRFGFSDIIARSSDDAGATLTPAARVDTGTAPGTAGSFDLALDANGTGLVGAAWADQRDGFLDVYASFSLDGGANWQPQDYRMDATAMPGTSDSERPAVYVSDDAVHVVWVDHRDGADGDIYYRRLAP